MHDAAPKGARAAPCTPLHPVCIRLGALRRNAIISQRSITPPPSIKHLAVFLPPSPPLLPPSCLFRRSLALSLSIPLFIFTIYSPSLLPCRSRHVPFFLFLVFSLRLLPLSPPFDSRTNRPCSPHPPIYLTFSSLPFFRTFSTFPHRPLFAHLIFSVRFRSRYIFSISLFALFHVYPFSLCPSFALHCPLYVFVLFHLSVVVSTSRRKKASRVPPIDFLSLRSSALPPPQVLMISSRLGISEHAYAIPPRQVLTHLVLRREKAYSQNVKRKRDPRVNERCIIAALSHESIQETSYAMLTIKERIENDHQRSW